MKKKLLFGITSLTLGGAERVLVDLANKLSNDYDVTIFTIYAKGDFENQLSKKVKIKSLVDKSYLELSTMKKKIIMPLKVLFGKKRIYNKCIKENYDVEIAFLEGPITRLFSTNNNNTRKIVWVHNDITSVFGNSLKAKLKKLIDRKIYSKYETIIFVSKDNLQKFNSIYNKLDFVNKKVIYNYIDKDIILKNVEEKIDVDFNKETINFITVARLVPQKAIDRLIKVHSKLIEDKLNHNIYVIGDGPEKENLQRLIKKYNVENTFHLLGKKENPYPYVNKADYFCLLSSFEGYGMVLEEAKILNKKIIITDTAAREAVEGYDKSLIVENDEKGIYEGLKDILIKKEEIINENEQNVYDNSEIIEQIKELIEK